MADIVPPRSLFRTRFNQEARLAAIAAPVPLLNRGRRPDPLHSPAGSAGSTVSVIPMIRPALCEEHPPDEKCDSCRTFSSRALRSARPCLTCQWVAAQRGEGSNLFDKIVKIHGPGGKESEHGVVLDLRSLAKLASKIATAVAPSRRQTETVPIWYCFCHAW